MRLFGVMLVAGLVLLTAGALGQTKAEQNFYKLSGEILKNLQEYWPVHATEMGVHEYDDAFTDYSANEVKKEKRRLRDYLARLYKYNNANLSVDARIDHTLIVSNCESAVVRLWGIRNHEKNPNIYIDDAVNGINSILLSEYIPLSMRLDNIIERMRKVPKFLDQAQKNLQNIPPIWLEYALNNIDNAIDYFSSTRDNLQREFPNRAEEISTASGGALQALVSFKRFLEQASPGAAGSFAIGAEHFNHLLEGEHLLDVDVDSLLHIGYNMIETISAEYSVVKEKLDAAGIGKNVPYYVPASFTRQDVLDYYTWEIDAVKEFIAENEILTLPENIGPCLPVVTPPFLQGVIGGIAYQPPGPFDAATTGYFYIPPIDEAEFEQNKQAFFGKVARRDFRGSVVHEAFPGHHLQLQLASRQSSDVRRWQMNNTFIEGWALYCEEMMYRQGLYADNPEKQLSYLRGILFRAARIVVDVKLHTGQFSIEEAIAFMMKTINLDEQYRAYIKKEVLRYTMDPTQPMSYLIGKLEIERLKQDVQARESDAFTLKAFHDRLLAEGSIPPSLIRRKLMK